MFNLMIIVKFFNNKILMQIESEKKAHAFSETRAHDCGIWNPTL